LEDLGYRIDIEQLHIMGLSNGGTATNVAYKGFADKFKTITFISTNINQTYPISSKVLFIGGGDDYFASSLLKGYHKLKKNGTQTDIFWDDKETHFIMVNKTDEIIDFINKNIQ
jgi:poly(3-hydroxybutyrate) depolymerase